MKTRRKFLASTSTVGLVTLSGCSLLGGKSEDDSTDEQPSVLTDIAVTTTDGSCTDVNSGDVRVEGNELLIDGTLVAPNACYEAQASSLNYTREINRLNITISPEKPDNYSECEQSTDTDCIAGVKYEASAELSGEVTQIVVTHRTGELTEVVARYTVPSKTPENTTPSESR